MRTPYGKMVCAELVYLSETRQVDKKSRLCVYKISNMLLSSIAVLARVGILTGLRLRGVISVDEAPWLNALYRSFCKSITGDISRTNRMQCDVWLVLVRYTVNAGKP